MALIKCAECGNEVSSLAAACPKCGAPVGATPPVATERVVTIQQTAKVYKGMGAAGAVIAGLGLALMFAGSAWGAWLFLIGFGLYLWARLAAWWKHD